MDTMAGVDLAAVLERRVSWDLVTMAGPMVRGSTRQGSTKWHVTSCLEIFEGADECMTVFEKSS
jgi:hypothetical protein